MTPWLATCLALLLPAAGCVLACARGAPGARLVGTQLLCTTVSLMLVAMTFAWDQPALIDLALTLAILGLPGAILFATFLERSL